jgi:hypothetical protein
MSASANVYLLEFPTLEKENITPRHRRETKKKKIKNQKSKLKTRQT